MQRGRFSQDQSAISPVIGAVLVFGLASSAFVIWSFTSLPVWIADNEELRNDQVAQAFATLQDGLRLLIADDGRGNLAISVPLSAPEVPLLQPGPSLGRLAYEDGFGWEGTFNNVVNHIENGAVVGGPQEAIDGDELLDVERFNVLSVALTAGGITGPGDAATIRLVADDGTDSVTGDLELHGNGSPGNNCPEAQLRFTITSTFSSTTRTTDLACLASTINGHVVDLLDNSIGFQSQLNRLDEGYTVTLTESSVGGSVAGDFGAVYQQTDGQSQLIGTGIAEASPVVRDANGGNLFFDPLNYHFEDQNIIWEGGAIMRQQGDSGAIPTTAGFDLFVDGATGHLRWSVIVIDGVGDKGGDGQANVALTLTGVDDQVLTCTDGSIVIDSTYSEIWAKFLRNRILVGGAGAATTVTDGTDQVTLALSTGGSVTEWVVEYEIINVQLTVS